jgi:hypothetical protein
MTTNQKKLALAGSSLMLALLTACGGSSDGGATNSPTSSPTVSGTAATGAAIVGGAVTAKCVTGTAAGTTGNDGSFNLDLSSGQTPPCILQVTKGTVTLYSYASTAGHVNITPLTDMALSKALADSPAVAFNNFDTAHQNSIIAGLVAAKAYVQAQIVAAGLGTPTGDLLTGTFAVGDSNDHILDALGTALTIAGKTSTDLRATAAGGAALTTLITSGTTPPASTGTTPPTGTTGSNLTVSAASNSVRNGTYMIGFIGVSSTGSDFDLSAQATNANGVPEMDVVWGADNVVKSAYVWFNTTPGTTNINKFFGCNNAGTGIPCSGITYNPTQKQVVFTGVTFSEITDPFGGPKPISKQTSGETATFNGTIVTP